VDNLRIIAFKKAYLTIVYFYALISVSFSLESYMTRLQMIAFDMNGTLIDDTEIFLITINMMFRRLGLQPVAHESLRREFGQPWTKIFRDRGITEEMKSGNDLYALYNKIYLSFYPIRPLSAVLEVLRKLRRSGLGLALLTTQQFGPSVRSLGKRNIGLFSQVLFGVSDKEAALSSLREDFGRVAYVGDQVADVIHSKSAGATAIAFTGGIHPRDMLQKAGPDFLIDDFRELPKLPFITKFL